MKKKIAILIDLELNYKAGGHVKFWERIAYSLKGKKLDFDLTLFFLGNTNCIKRINDNINFQILKPILSSKILTKFGIDADSTDLSPLNLRLLFKLRNFNLIHTTDQLFAMSKTASIASKIWNIPLTTSFHTDTPSYTEYYVLNILNKLPSLIKEFFINRVKLHEWISNNQKKKILRYINKCKFAFVNDSFSREQMKFLKGCKIKIDKISRGIDKKVFFKKKLDKNKFLKRFKINENNQIIFFCGRIHSLKGAVLLAEIQKILNNKNTKVITVMAGENIHGDLCKKICKDNLQILDYLSPDDVSNFYNICDLFVFPSLYETGPQVVMEARACGAICVVSKLGGGKRIKKSGYDGIILNSQKTGEWVIEIEKLLNNSQKANLMQKKVLELAKYLSWEEIFTKIFLRKWKLLF